MKKLLFIVGILFSAISMQAQCNSVNALSSVYVTLEPNGEFLYTPDLGLIGDYSSCTLTVGLLDTITNEYIILPGPDMLLNCSHVGTYTVETAISGFGIIRATLIIDQGVNSCQVNVPADTYAMNFTKRNFGGAISTDATLNGNAITQYYDWLWFLPEADLVSGENTIVFPTSAIQSGVSGISSLDVVFGQRMILDSVQYPLRAVLSDLDGSGYLNINDLLIMRQLILGIITSIPAQNNLFISKTYSFPSNFDPFDFTDLNFREYKFNDATVTADDLNFFVYKLGDINEVTDSIGGSTPLVSRSNKELVIENRDVIKGETITVPLSVLSDDITINGLQFSLEFNGLSLSDVSHNYSDNQLGYNEVSDKDLRFVLTDYYGWDEVELLLELEVTEDGSLSDMISLNNSIDPFLTSYTHKSKLDIVFRTTSSTQEILDLNTTLLSSQLVIDLPTNHENTVNVYSLEGRLVQQYKARDNQVIIDRTDLQASGMYFISTQIEDKLVTKKFIAL